MQLSFRRTTIVGFSAVLLAPLVGVLALRAPLFNNLPYRDPWFYSGYGWTLSHHIEVFGWFYYAVRFPVILPIRWFTDVFGPVTGYLVLRYLILAATGGVLYACVRRFSSMWVAAASVVLLALNPFYMRMILWDYTSYVAVPCGVAGVALWLMSSTRDRVFRPFVVSGALYGVAVFANPLSVTLGVPLFVIEVAASLRRGVREFQRLALRLASAALGFTLVFVGGYFGYRIYLGAYSPRELVEPTLDFVRANDQLSAPFQLPAGVFLDGEPRIYAPILLCAAMVVAMGRQLFEDSLAGRLAQYAIGYVALIWLYRFAVTSSVVETWWAYNMTAVSMSFAVALILDQLARREANDLGLRAVLAASLGSVAITTIAIRNANSWAIDVYEEIRDNATLVVLLLVVGLGAAVGMRVFPGWGARATATGVFFALVAVVALTPARYIGINQTGEFVPDGRGDLHGYQAAYDMAKLLEETDQPDSRTLLWTTAYGPTTVVWTNLPHQTGAIQNPEAPPSTLAKVEPWEASLVHYPTTQDVLLLSNDPADMERGLAALRRVDVDPVVRRRGAWANGQLQYALVDVTQRSS